LYVGAHIGAGLMNSSTGATEPPFGTFTVGNNSGSGIIGGGQIGYNVQSGWLVYGLEGSFTASGMTVDGSCLIASCKTDANWFAAVTGRVGGLVNDRTLAYVKGGAVWMDADYTVGGVGIGGPALGEVSASKTRLGYLLGAGVEYKFNERWSGFSEYNFMDFGRDNVDFVVPLIGTGTLESKDTAHVFKVGVNYKLW
jgi:outer membrane immunogenic protein